MTDKEKLDKLYQFLTRVHLGGYIELSQDKVRGEYQYFIKKAGELLWEVFPETFPPSEPLDDVDMDF